MRYHCCHPYYFQVTFWTYHILLKKGLLPIFFCHKGNCLILDKIILVNMMTKALKTIHFWQFQYPCFLVLGSVAPWSVQTLQWCIQVSKHDFYGVYKRVSRSSSGVIPCNVPCMECDIYPFISSLNENILKWLFTDGSF